MNRLKREIIKRVRKDPLFNLTKFGQVEKHPDQLSRQKRIWIITCKLQAYKRGLAAILRDIESFENGYLTSGDTYIYRRRAYHYIQRVHTTNEALQIVKHEQIKMCLSLIKNK